MAPFGIGNFSFPYSRSRFDRSPMTTPTNGGLDEAIHHGIRHRADR
jgi:hypothetical protein